MRSDNNPCLDCKARTLGCHDKCKQRALWLDKHRQEKEVISRKKYRDHYFKLAIEKSVRRGSYGS